MRNMIPAERNVILIAPVECKCVVAHHLQEKHYDRVFEEFEVKRKPEAQTFQLL